MALVREGAALRNQSKLDESGKALSEAVAVLGKLRQQGDLSEATAVGLGLGLTSEARVAGSQNKRPDERAFATQAVDVLKPLMAAPNPSIPLRRAYGLAMTYLGFSQANTEEEEAAVADAGGSAQSLSQHRRSQTRRPAVGGRVCGSLRLADECAADSGSFRQSQRSRRRRPEGDGEGPGKASWNMSALRARALMSDSLSATEGVDLHLRKALALSQQAVRDWEAIVALDPSNQIAWNNLVSAPPASGILVTGLRRCWRSPGTMARGTGGRAKGEGIRDDR